MNRFLKGISNYDKRPFVEIRADEYPCYTGWAEISKTINKILDQITGKQKIIVFECYHGTKDDEIIPALRQLINAQFYFSKDCMKSANEIDRLVFPDVTDDEVFGYMTSLTLKDFFDPIKVRSAKEEIATTNQTIAIYGVGASYIHTSPDLLIYLDMARWELQLRFRRNEISNLGIDNKSEKASLQYKRAFFVDWRVCDRHKKTLLSKWDLVIDTNDPAIPKMLSGQTIRDAFQKVVQRPFRVVPFFDPGPWGGQWMKEYFGLDAGVQNFAWGFDCVPEENSLLIKIGTTLFETPSINVVFYQPEKLLGKKVWERFGEFPIRFDFLDTMGGGNLSLQVHPTTEYIRDKFGMYYTQDESYYIMDAAKDAYVFLGLKENVSGTEMLTELQEAQLNEGYFEAIKFVEQWPAKKHDHFLIPAGTIHCSGANNVVLEISATPYIFTFKLWDWGRMGLDGKPRPINIEHGSEVIDWSRTTGWVKKELINVNEKIAEGDGWKEECTGLHETEFIETRRHWFNTKVHHHTAGSVNVLNLVEGKEVVVESPGNNFEPFIVHYAETFIVPEAVKEYTIRPYNESEGSTCATIKAFVRTNQ